MAFYASAESASEYFEAAITKFNNKDYRASVILLKNALKQDAQHLPSRILLGKSLLQTGDVASAEKNLKLALDYGADESQVISLLGSTYLVQGKYEQLLKEIHSGGRADKVEMQILVLRAYANLHLGNLDQAENYFKRAQRLQPNHPGPLLGLATIAIRRDNIEMAEEFVAKAAKLEPNQAEMLYANGEIARLRGNMENAISLFNQSIELDPQQMQARLSRAALLTNRGDDQLAQQDIDYIRSKSPNNLQAVYLNAMLMVRTGKYKEAYSELQSISNSLSRLTTGFLNNHPPTILLMGTLDFLMNNLEKAKSRLKRYIKLQPSHLQPRLLLAETLIKLGDNVGALLTLKPMLDTHPDNVDLLFLTGTAYLFDKQYSKASEYLDRAASLKPDLARLRTRLAVSKLGEGDSDSALQDLESVLKMDGDHAKPGILLANIQLRKGLFDEALTTLKQLQHEMPGNPLVHNLAGLAHLSKNDRLAAHSDFSKAIEVAPNFQPGRLNLAAVEAAEKHYDLAKKHYDEVLRQSPADIRAMEGMAKIAEQQNQTREAISWLEKIRNTDSAKASTAVLTRLAELYLQSEEPELALEVARELGNLVPGDLVSLELKGRAQLVLGNLPKAARLFRVMHQSKPDSVATLQRIGALLMQAGDLENASKAIDDALNKEPGYLPAWGTRILIEQQLGNLDQALEHARQLRNDEPTLSLGYRLVGDILMQSGDFGGASEAYAGGLRVAPSNAMLILQFRAENARGNKQAAKKLLIDWLEKNPDDYMVHNVLAALYLHDGDFDKARDHYEKMLEIRPDHGPTYNNLAVLYARMKLPQALDMAQRAYQLDPKDPATNDTLGWILVQRGEYQKGLDFLREAYARTSQDAEVGYHLAVALHGLGRTEEAILQLKAALAPGREFSGYQAAQDMLGKLTSK